MSFTPAFLAELRDRLPLSDIAGKRIRLTRAGREYKACCPFHNEKSPSFYINDDKQFYHCFGCGAHGDIIGFVMHHDRLSFPEAVEALATQAGLPMPRDTPVDREKFDQEKRNYQLLDRATAWFEEQLFAPIGRDALDYLRMRGLSLEAIRRFRLGFAPNDGQLLLRKLTSEGYKIEELVAVGLVKKNEERNEFYSFFRNRAMFPVGDRRGRTVAFGGRVMGDGEPKYLNSPDHSLFHKGKLLYGLSRARTAITSGQPLIVVEGYMDVIAMVEAGYSGAVAPLGTAMTDDQLMLLWKLLPPENARDPSRDYSPILCFDGDSAGLRAASRAMERTLPLLTPSQTIRIATMVGAKDPDDLLRQSGKSAMDGVLKQAKPMIDVIWELTLEGRQMRTPEERAAFMTSLKQRVGRIGHEGLRQLYQDEIQKRFNTAFRWQPETKNSLPRDGRNIKGRSWQPPMPPLPMINRKMPVNPKRLFEKALLALMLNYPALFADFGEDFGRLNFINEDLEAIRQRIIDIMSLDSQEPLDAEELYRHLSHTGSHAPAGKSGLLGLDEVLSEATYIHVGFAKPGRKLDEARQGWKSVWNKHLQEQLQVDLQSARRLFAADKSEENYTRLMSLRGQVEALLAESGESYTIEAPLPSHSQEH